MNWFNLVAGAIGGLVVGVVIGLLNHLLQKKHSVIEARIRAYAPLLGRIRNLFLDNDKPIESTASFFMDLKSDLSVIYLIGSDRLYRLVVEYERTLREYVGTIRSKAEPQVRNAFLKRIQDLIMRIRNQMRKDIEAV